MRAKIVLIIPALNEAGSISSVVQQAVGLAHESEPLFSEIIVVDNGSTDATARVAKEAGATVITESRRGYGRACQSGVDYCQNSPNGSPDILLFIEGDGSSDLTSIQTLLAPILNDEADFVLGSRVNLAEPGSLTLPQKFGNLVACFLIWRLYKVRYSDLASVRAIRWSKLQAMQMQEMTYGWTVEMQVKAAKQGLRIEEIEVRTFPRSAGTSKVSGNLYGAMLAGWFILTRIVRYR